MIYIIIWAYLLIGFIYTFYIPEKQINKVQAEEGKAGEIGLIIAYLLFWWAIMLSKILIK